MSAITLCASCCFLSKKLSLSQTSVCSRGLAGVNSSVVFDRSPFCTWRAVEMILGCVGVSGQDEGAGVSVDHRAVLVVQDVLHQAACCLLDVCVFLGGKRNLAHHFGPDSCISTTIRCYSFVHVEVTLSPWTSSTTNMSTQRWDSKHLINNNATENSTKNVSTLTLLCVSIYNPFVLFFSCFPPYLCQKLISCIFA